MRISDEQLEYWSDIFVQRGFANYMTLPQFLEDPQGICERLDGTHGFRPLLLQQRYVAESLRRQTRDLCSVIEDLERTVDGLVRKGGHYFEPMKHHAHPR